MCAEDASERLLTSVRQPRILEVNVPTISVGFETGPNVPGTQFTIKCVVQGQGCDAPAQGLSVEGVLPVQLSAVEGTVQGLGLDQSYSCFVETSFKDGGKVSYCEEAETLPGSVRVGLIFPSYPNATAFGVAEQDQICSNILSLQPEGVCSVLRVLSGSAVVLLEISYDDYRDAWSLALRLRDGQGVDETLAQGLQPPVEIAAMTVNPRLPDAENGFSLLSNGVTVACPDATVGSRGIVNGIVYTKVDEAQLRARVADELRWRSLENVCTTGVGNMSRLFDSTAFNRPIGSWDTSSVRNMSGMFYSASIFNEPIRDWNTSSVEDMSEMFSVAVAFNQSIENWDTSSVRDMSEMFFVAKAFNQPVGDWNTTSVEDMKGMFAGARVFNQEVGRWNTSSVKSMQGMFLDAMAFNQPIGDWDTSSVQTMLVMLSSASAFNQPIGDWNTSLVQTMGGMFASASAFNQSIGEWDTSSVVDMAEMFFNALSFDQNISQWDVDAVVKCAKFATGATSFTNAFKPTFINCNPAR